MSFCVVELTQGFVAVVDAKDFDVVNGHGWHVHFSKGRDRPGGKPYARATIGGKKIYMHRLLTEAPKDMQVDHLNHCTLDNRRENLEIVDHLTNQERRRGQNKARGN